MFNVLSVEIVILILYIFFAKLLNKRFDFSEDNIKETFTSDAPQSAVIEEQAHTSAINVDTCILKLKYRVKNCPFNYEWTLKRQTVTEVCILI